MSSNYNSSASLPAYGMSAVNCTTYPPLQPNSDISGIGVLISFLGTAYLTFLCCLAKYILDLYQKKVTHTRAKQLSRWSFAIENAIVSFSDQQLVTGISIIVGGLQQLQWGLAIYHFQEVGNLAWFSTMTHILTLTVLREKMQLKSSLVIRTVRIVLMGCLVVLLACVMAPLGYISSAYGFYGLGNPGYRNDTIQGPIPAEFPAWCLYHPSTEWDGEDGLRILNTGNLGYNKAYIVFTLGLIIYGYISRVLLLLPGLASEYLLRIPPGQPWVSFELGLEKLKTRSDRTPVRVTRTTTFITGVARLTRGFLYSFYVLLLSGKHVYGSKIWELSWLLLALVWGTLRIFTTNNDYFFPPNPEVISQQNMWGFGQVVALLLLALPFLSFWEAYLDYADENPESNQIIGTANTSTTLTVLSQETEVQKEIYAEAWYRYVLILWYMASFSIGGSGLIVLALSGGIELNSSFPSTVGSVKIAILPGGIQAYVQIYGIIVAINIGLLWLFILLLLPRWFVSSNQTALAVLTFVWIVFMSVNVYFAGFIGFLYIGAWESGLAKEDYGG